MSTMLRLFTDLQAADEDDACFILKYGDDLMHQADIPALGLVAGDRVILDPLEDFELEGVLAFKFSERLGKHRWVAYPDLSTRRDKAD